MEHPAAIRTWLWSCAALCAAMVMVGGITRLTGSGLSITEWNVVTGAVPPLTEAAWAELFAGYQRSPQYLKENTHFLLADFQRIFWWEWAHRLLGRVVGLVYLLPLLFFWQRGRLQRWLVRRGTLLFALIAFQGLLGWLMVASGLVDEPRVSHFRLAAHLSTAFFTMALTIWTALQAGQQEPAAPRRAAPIWGFVALLTIQICWGAFVAGLRAGLLFNHFPTMDGVHWIAAAVGTTSPWWRDLLDNPATVQLVHRWLGVLVVIAAVFVALRTARVAEALRAAIALGAVAALQLALGLLTLLYFHEAPVFLGALHQAGAALLLATAVVAAFRVSSASLVPVAAGAEPAGSGAGDRLPGAAGTPA